VIRKPLILLIRLYQAAVSPHLGRWCRFEPSCSEYARQALERHGAARGAWLAARRLARCHPFCAGGHDPVPPRAGEALQKPIAS
jgi:putative membrane protein insertion efficiency factor